MGRILTISSQVVRGHVGLSAIVPALQRLGHEVLPVPTIVLSNHPGHLRAAGTRIEVNTLVSMLEVLDANGWLVDIDAVMTGYLPTPQHVAFAARAIDLVRQRSSSALVLVDPVIGDDPRGLYIDAAVAAAIRAELVPRAHIITPNRFELSWLSGCDVASIDQTVAAAAAFDRADLLVIATSIPAPEGHLANVATSAAATAVCRVERRAKVPHGTGDLFTGLYLGHALATPDVADSLAKAVAGVGAAIANSHGRDDLLLAIAPPAVDWSCAAPLAVERHT